MSNNEYAMPNNFVPANNKLMSDSGYSMSSWLGDPAYAELTVENEGHAMPNGNANLYQETAFPNLNQSNPSFSSFTASDLHNRRSTETDEPYFIGEIISNPLFVGFSTNPEGRHQMHESTVDSDIATESKISFVDRIPRIVKRGLLALILIMIAIAVAGPVSMRSNSSNLLDGAHINASASNSITVNHNASNDTSVTPASEVSHTTADVGHATMTSSSAVLLATTVPLSTAVIDQNPSTADPGRLPIRLPQ